MRYPKHVREWFDELLDEGTCFHPDTPFQDYVNRDGHPSYTPDQVEYLNAKMNEAFEICDRFGKDIFELAIEAYDDYENKFKP